MKEQHYKYIPVGMSEYNSNTKSLKISFSIIVWVSLRQTGKTEAS